MAFPTKLDVPIQPIFVNFFPYYFLLVQSCNGGHLTPQVLRDQSLRALRCRCHSAQLRSSNFNIDTTYDMRGTWQNLKENHVSGLTFFPFPCLDRSTESKNLAPPKKRSLTRCFAMQISKSSATKLVKQIQRNTHDEMIRYFMFTCKPLDC